MIPNYTQEASDELMAVVTGRSKSVFAEAYEAVHSGLADLATNGPILVAGAAGSIGSAVVRILHEVDSASVVMLDTNENGLTELVRDLHASGLARPEVTVRPVLGDVTSRWLPIMREEVGPFHTIMNFSAVKHVRSERDVMSLLRMYEVNVAGTLSLLDLLRGSETGTRFFSVSSDKAANPTSMMGASKRLMELSMAFENTSAEISTCRFANVAFSAGSLLESWLQRIARRQPIAVPTGIRRFFITPREASELCIVSVCRGGGSIVIPDLRENESLKSLQQVLSDVLAAIGTTPEYFDTEHDAVAAAAGLAREGRQAVMLTPGDTTGEKPYEEFLGEGELGTSLRLPSVLSTPLACHDIRPSRVMEILARTHRDCVPTMMEFLDAVEGDVPTFTRGYNEKSLDDRL